MLQIYKDSKSDSYHFVRVERKNVDSRRKKLLLEQESITNISIFLNKINEKLPEITFYFKNNIIINENTVSNITVKPLQE